MENNVMHHRFGRSGQTHRNGCFYLDIKAVGTGKCWTAAGKSSLDPRRLSGKLKQSARRATRLALLILRCSSPPRNSFKIYIRMYIYIEFSLFIACCSRISSSPCYIQHIRVSPNLADSVEWYKTQRAALRESYRRNCATVEREQLINSRSLAVSNLWSNFQDCKLTLGYHRWVNMTQAESIHFQPKKNAFLPTLTSANSSKGSGKKNGPKIPGG